jgi:hypothetical protein
MDRYSAYRNANPNNYSWRDWETTDDCTEVFEEIAEPDNPNENPRELALSYIDHRRETVGPLNPDEWLEYYRATRNEIVEPPQEIVQIAQDKPKTKRKVVGALWKGYDNFKEFENNDIYIPTSNWCMHKVWNKAVELQSVFSSVKLEYTGNQYGIPIQTFYEILRQSGASQVDKNNLPTALPTIYCYSEGKFEKVNKNRTSSANSAIFLLQVSDQDEYHSILVKDKNWFKTGTLEMLTKHVQFEKIKELRSPVSECFRFPEYLPKAKRNFCVSYDIETYVEHFINGKGEKVKRLIPYSLGYMHVDLSYETKDLLEEKNAEKYAALTESKVNILTLGKDCESKLMCHFVEVLAKQYYDILAQDTEQNASYWNTNKVVVYAHNGSRFDNLYLKGCDNVVFLTEISNGSTIKVLKLKHKDYPTILEFRCTVLYLGNSLKECCEMFKIDTPKQDFDIVDKSREWYEQHDDSNVSDDPLDFVKFCVETVNWKQYLIYDVLSLAKVIFKLNSFIWGEYGMQITQYSTVSSFAIAVATKNCQMLNETFTLKHNGTMDFIRESVYGGRVLCWRQYYDSEHYLDLPLSDQGLCCLDANSLYPSAMALFDFPTGRPTCVNETDEACTLTELERLLKNNGKFIAEVEIDAGNIRYPIHPYKTEKNQVFKNGTKATGTSMIYKSGIIRGVYNSVDIEEMLHDGYVLKKVYRYICWPTSGPIFKKLITRLYELRNQYKKDSNEFEVVIKLILNSIYGKFLQNVTSKTYFANEFKDDANICTELENGQFICHKDTHSRNDMPSYIGSFILAYSRRIMNNLIRKIGPEHVYYSDTDSLYIPMHIFNAKKLEFTDGLGGFKNDYGSGTIIKKAIFLDLKRYVLLIQKTKTEKEQKDLEINLEEYYRLKYLVPETKDTANQLKKLSRKIDKLDFPEYAIKAKFNGLSFKNIKNDSFSNFYAQACEKSYMPELEKDQFKLNKRDNGIFKMYYQFLEYPGDINENTIIIDKWNRLMNGVQIAKQEFKYMIDSRIRGQYIDKVWYPHDFDFDQGSRTLNTEPSKFIINFRTEHVLRTERHLLGAGFASSLPYAVDATDEEVTEFFTERDPKFFATYTGFYYNSEGALRKHTKAGVFTVDRYGIREKVADTANEIENKESFVVGLPKEYLENCCTETISINEYNKILRSLNDMINKCAALEKENAELKAQQKH